MTFARLHQFFSTLLFCLFLSACQTVNTAPTSANGAPDDAESGEERVSWALYTPFFDRHDHLRSLIFEDKDMQKAARLHEEQSGYFERNKETSREALNALAAHLNAPFRLPIRQALENLETLAWPAPVSEWPGIKEKLANAKRLIATYPDHPLLKDIDFRLALVSELETRLQDTVNGIFASAPSEYLSFDHFSAETFADIYPALEDKGVFLRNNIVRLKPRLESAGSDDLEHLVKSHPLNLVGPENWNWLSNLYLERKLSELEGSVDNRLKRSLHAFRAARSLGLEVERVPGVSITFVEATSKTLLKQGQIDFKTEVDLDIPVSAKIEKLDLAFPDDQQDQGFVIILDVALAKARRWVRDMRQVKSLYVAGYEKEENPEYDRALLNYREAADRALRLNYAADLAHERSRSRTQNITIQDPYSYRTYRGTYTESGGLFDGLLEAYEAGQANKEARQFKEILLNTPKHVEVAIHNEYVFENALIDASKLMTVNYYVVDRQSRRIFKSTFDVSESHKFSVAYGLNDKDTDHTKHLRTFNRESDVTDWESRASTIKLSALIDNYLSEEEKATSFQGLVPLRKQILADKNRVLARPRQQGPETPRLADARMESVVAIYTGSGKLGSGFYVAPDVVLTNWHVVKDHKFVEMKLSSKLETFGKVFAKDVRLDLALVKVQNRGLPAKLYRGDKLELGSSVDVIGHPQGFEFSITRGIISSVRRHRSVSGVGGNKVLYVQTDAPISGGNSGGPLFLADQVIGVNTWIYTGSDGLAQNLNFSVHHSEVREFLKRYLPGASQTGRTG